MEKKLGCKRYFFKIPPGVTGTVVDVRVFSRRGIEKDERAIAIERAEIERFAKDRDDEKEILERAIMDAKRMFLVKVVSARYFKKGTS